MSIWKAASARITEALVLEAGKKVVEEAHTRFKQMQTLPKRLEAIESRLKVLEEK